jgi:hypothetical protein
MAMSRQAEKHRGQNAYAGHACFAPVNPCSFLAVQGRKASVKCPPQAFYPQLFNARRNLHSQYAPALPLDKISIRGR